MLSPKYEQNMLKPRNSKFANFLQQLQSMPSVNPSDYAHEYPLYQLPKINNPIQAAVLIPIIQRDPFETILLTKRGDNLKHHAGQISFPGGRLDNNDDTLLECAIRETTEEVGIEKEQIKVIGNLGQWPSYSGFMISVYLGLVETPIEYKLCEQEVAEVFELPIDYALDLSNFEKVNKKMNDKLFTYYQLNYEDKKIWGFTAGIMYLLSKMANEHS